MQNQFDNNLFKKSLELNSIHYYTKKLEKGNTLQAQHQRMCAQMILNHLQEQGCEKNLLQSLEQFFTKNHRNASISKQSLPPVLDLSLHQLISTKIGTSNDTIVQNALLHYVQHSDPLSKRSTRAQRIEQKAQQILSLNGARRHSQSTQGPIKYMKRLKTCFGHALHPDNQDQEDPYIPVYNIIFDRSGQLLITGDDLGLIKIWSSSNGLLLQSLKGHTMAINSMDISFCNKYLASCSNDGLVLVWEIQTARPIAALKEAQEDPILVLLYHQQDKDHNYLALASEKGFVYIYNVEDIVKCNGGMLGTQYNQKLRPTAITHNCEIIRLQVHSRVQYIKEKINKVAVNGIICMEFNKQGYLAMGTEQGDIIIWDQPDKLMGQQQQQQQNKKIEWHEHSAECHLAKWNKDGNKLLSASFDGSARIWKWNEGGLGANTNNRSEVILKYKSNDSKRSGDICCWAIAWSAKSNYTLASFSKKIKNRVGEDDKAKTQIQVYSNLEGKVINYIDSDSFAEIVKMDVKVVLIEAHPFIEEIALTADQNGIIVLWNILTGIPSKVFHERGYHMKLPNLEVPLLDGCFSPNGLTFVISSDYGSFSIYGYGASEIYDQTPVEQFYVSDSEHPIIDESQGFRVLALDSDMEFCFVDRGSICNFYRMPYQYNICCNFKNQYPHIVGQIENLGKKSVNFQKPKVFQFIQSSKGISIDNRKNDEMFVSYFNEVLQLEKKITEELQKMEEHQNQERVHVLEQRILELFEICEQNSEKSSSKGKLFRKAESKDEELIKIAVQKNMDSEVNNQNQIKQSQRNRKVIDSDEEQQNQQEELSSQVITTRHRRQQQRNQQQRLSTLNTHRQIRNRQTTASCVRCKIEITEQQQQSCSGCLGKYHKECGDIRLTNIEGNQFCLNCLPGQVRNKKLNYGSRDKYLEDLTNQPQIGDTVIFFTLGYESFIQKNLHQLDLSQLNVNGTITGYPGDKFNEQQDANYIYCKVINWYYIFPVQNINLPKGKSNNILQVFELKFNDLQFRTFYSPEFEQYLIIDQVYSQCVKQIRPLLNSNTLIQTDIDKESNLGFQYKFIEQDTSDKNLYVSDWQIIQCKQLTNQQQIGLNFWEIASIKLNHKIIDINGASLQSVLTEIEVQQIIKEINNLLKKQPKIGYFFLNSVDINEYPEYPNYVAVQCNISMIMNKLETYFYRSKEELINDIQRVQVNAAQFNPPQSDVCVLAEKLVVQFQNIVNSLDNIVNKQQKVQQQTYEIVTRKKRRQF